MTENTPRIWLVLGDKLGDNAQVEIIARGLGMPYETRRVLPQEKYVLGKPWFRASLYHLDLQRSDRLEPPWPDVVITVGRRPSMAALWIKKQSQGHTKVILVGRPRRWIERFDLIITPPQYRIPPLNNVFRLQFPAMRPDPQRIADQVEIWRPRMQALARPLVAVLVGGPTRPMIFDAAVARQLVADASVLAAGGTLFVTTSRRTPAAVVETLRAELPANAQLFVWDPQAPDNPYQALLGLADRFMVTGDSISMMVEVACVGKPLYIFRLPETRLGHAWKRLQRALLPDSARASGLQHIGLLLYRLGILGFPRNLGAFHDELIDQGYARQPGSTAPDEPATIKKVPEDLSELRARILALLNTTPRSGA